MLWTDAGGYDAAATIPPPTTAPATNPAEPNGVELLRGGEITLRQLQAHVDQIVIHFDACGTSRECFHVLQQRQLSVQLMCDLDGTIYQTMDLKEKGYHATIANERSIGIETANIGGYESSTSPALFKQWYKRENGWTLLTVPQHLGDGGIRTPHFVGRPARAEPIVGNVQGKLERQYDYTPQQYQALAHMSAALCTIFPKIQPDYPRQAARLGTPATGPAGNSEVNAPATLPGALAEPDEPGLLIPHTLTRPQYADFQGIVGHYHVQLNKDDPGPAFQWPLLIHEARGLMSAAAAANNVAHRHQPVGLPIVERHAATESSAPTSAPASAPASIPATSPVATTWPRES